MSKKDRKRREAARRQKEQRQAKLAASKESAEEDALEEAPEPEDEASRAKRRAEQKREYEKSKRKKARSGQSLAPALWGGGVVAVLAVAIFGGFLLLSGGSDDGGTPAPSATPDPRIADLPIDRTINIETDDDGQNVLPRYVPNAISGDAGEVIEILVTNVGSVAHNLRFPGSDGEYNTRDDWFVQPGTLFTGDTGRVVVKFDEPGSYPFRCDFHVLDHLGTLTLR